jgi:hypothetical protein
MCAFVCRALSPTVSFFGDVVCRVAVGKILRKKKKLAIKKYCVDNE